ncbi:hypothetical protein Dimus_022397 [Dionaea muscipula]
MTVIHLKKKDVVKTSVKGVAIEFDHLKLASILGIPETMEFVRTGENRRRDDDNEAPAEEVHEEEEPQNAEFDWEVVIDEAADLGESGSGEKFYDAEDEIQEPAAVVEEVPAVAAQASAQQKETTSSGVDPSGPSGYLPESVMNKLQAEFERARADRIQADLEKAQAENAKLLTLLHKPKTYLDHRISIAKPTDQTLIIFCT